MPLKVVLMATSFIQTRFDVGTESAELSRMGYGYVGKQPTAKEVYCENYSEVNNCDKQSATGNQLCVFHDNL